MKQRGRETRKFRICRRHPSTFRGESTLRSPPSSTTHRRNHPQHRRPQAGEYPESQEGQGSSFRFVRALEQEMDRP